MKLSEALLATANPVEQKNMIGEILYPLIFQQQPDQAGDITLMLLEAYKKDQLLHLIQSPEALHSKIEEAVRVLKAYNTLNAAYTKLCEELLATNDPVEQKNMIGEILYPLIFQQQPDQAGKITGMLLEAFEKDRLLHLIQSPEALHYVIDKCVSVLIVYNALKAASSDSRTRSTIK